MSLTQPDFPMAGRVRALRRARPRALKWTIRSLCSALLLSLAGCAGAPFDIKNKVELPPPSASAARAESSGIAVQADVLRDEDYLNDIFDANLILASVLPIRLKVTNEGEAPVDLSKAKFEINAANGKAYKSAEAKKAFKRLISYYEITTYSKPAYKQSEETFISYALDLSKPLDKGASREGLIFFIVPEAANLSGSVKLKVSRLDQKGTAVELNLN
jgi:hypothetical protein